jgi:hypothetical protein
MTAVDEGVVSVEPSPGERQFDRHWLTNADPALSQRLGPPGIYDQACVSTVFGLRGLLPMESRAPTVAFG